jgi:hypothetical protein
MGTYNLICELWYGNRWEDDMKMNLKEREYENMDCFQVAQDRV